MTANEMVLTDTQRQILDAAMSTIAREGMEGSSMRAVAEAADVSLGLLSYHFDDKQALIVAAFRLATQRLYDVSAHAIEDPSLDPEERVARYVSSSFDAQFLDDDYLALRTSLWAISRTNAEIAAVERELYDRYATRLIELICEYDPDLSPDEARGRATDCIVHQNGLWLNWARLHRRDDLARGLQRVRAIALGLTAGT